MVADWTGLDLIGLKWGTRFIHQNLSFNENISQSMTVRVAMISFHFRRLIFISSFISAMLPNTRQFLANRPCRVGQHSRVFHKSDRIFRFSCLKLPECHSFILSLFPNPKLFIRP
jgi:hypothetical protein